MQPSQCSNHLTVVPFCTIPPDFLRVFWQSAPHIIAHMISFHVHRCETKWKKIVWKQQLRLSQSSPKGALLCPASIRVKYRDFSESHKSFSGRASPSKWLLPSLQDAASRHCGVFCPRVLNQIRRCSNYKVALGWNGASLVGLIFKGEARNLHFHLLMSNYYSILQRYFQDLNVWFNKMQKVRF